MNKEEYTFSETAGFFHTAIQAAAIGGSVETLQLLLRKGAIPWLIGGHHGSAYIAAIRCGNFDILNKLFERDHIINPSLGDGSQLGTADAATGLTLNQFAEDLKRTLLTAVDPEHGWSLIFRGASSDNADRFSISLRHESLVHQRSGRWALHH